MTTSATARPAASAAPALVQHLIGRFLLGVVKRAYVASAEIISADDDLPELVSQFIEDHAESYFADGLPEALEANSLYRRQGGTMQTAFQEPAFALEFILAFRLFYQGGAR